MNFRFTILLFLILLFSCGKKDIDLSKIKNLNGNKITVFGHAGMGIASQFPINTFESINSALASGAGGVEVDIQMTKDSVLVLFHNRFLEEQTNLEGLISEREWSYVQEATYIDPIFSEYKIISLDQLFSNLKELKNYQFSFDLEFHEAEHPDSYISTYVNALIKVIEKHSMSENVFIESQRTRYLEKMQMLRPDFNLFYWENSATGIQIAINMNLYGFIIQTDYITAEQIKEAHDAGIRVSLFGLQSKEENLDAIEKSPDFLQTDKVNYLVKVLK